MKVQLNPSQLKHERDDDDDSGLILFSDISYFLKVFSST